MPCQVLRPLESHVVLFLGQLSVLWPPCLHPVFMGSERPWREQDAADSEPVDSHWRHAEGSLEEAQAPVSPIAFTQSQGIG